MALNILLCKLSKSILKAICCFLGTIVTEIYKKIILSHYKFNAFYEKVRAKNETLCWTPLQSAFFWGGEGSVVLI